MQSKKAEESLIKRIELLFKSISRCERKKITRQTVLSMWPVAKKKVCSNSH